MNTAQRSVFKNEMVNAYMRRKRIANHLREKKEFFLFSSFYGRVNKNDNFARFFLLYSFWMSVHLPAKFIEMLNSLVDQRITSLLMCARECMKKNM